MFRSVTSRVGQSLQAVSKQLKVQNTARVLAPAAQYSTAVIDEKTVPLTGSFVGELYPTPVITKRYVEFFKNPGNDGWVARGAMNDLMSHPCVPEPEVTIEVMHSCRRMNDYALAVRFLESVKFMMHEEVDKIWPWYKQELGPTLQELGVLTPEEMGYDKPELYAINPEDIH